NPSMYDMAPLYGLKTGAFDKFECHLYAALERRNLFHAMNFEEGEGDLKEMAWRLGRHGVHFVTGWLFKVKELTEKYQDFFISKYTLLPEFYEDTGLYKDFSSIDRDKYARVAVHIRRGDYKTWEGGRFFYQDADYSGFMARMRELVRDGLGKDCAFFIFSNDSVSISGDNVRLSDSPWYVDQFVMSRCDYIIGPPSTFSLWASYTGRTALYHVKDKNHPFTLADFEYCHG
ncbi:MAG: hypothetical protein IJU95_02380, partial [Treponema sp.]|nr:hypothetical protein [Treponema sp.]